MKEPFSNLCTRRNFCSIFDSVAPLEIADTYVDGNSWPISIDIHMPVSIGSDDD